MINTILTASGVQYRESHYRKPPAGAYAVYFDDVTVTGPDPVNPATTVWTPAVYHHAATVELYAPDPEAIAAAEADFEAALRSHGMTWTKQARYWIQTEQIYQTIYEISYIEKRRP